MHEIQSSLVIGKQLSQKCREFLEKEGVYDKSRKVVIFDDKSEIPVTDFSDALKDRIFEQFSIIPELKERVAEVQDPKNNIKLLHSEVRKRIEGYENVQDLPQTYEIYNDLILLPSQCLRESEEYIQQILNIICDIFRVCRVARKNAVVNDKFRSPRTDLLLGTDPWVFKIENKIKYNFNIRKSMFCRGNISEKLRISKFLCAGEMVVDLFAGIGYFALPYLVHAKASHVIACEWNPNSVEALKMNLKEAKVEDRCTVLLGDNREVCPVEVADRVNLGLIPSSSISWKTAVLALKKEGGTLHIHANVEVKPGEEKRTVWQTWSAGTSDAILNLLQEHKGGSWSTEILHIECVKSYGPRIYHIVLDLNCSLNSPAIQS